ncbi:MAG TPA: dephospho-CoA kinase [Sphingomicrobium sp.]|jgi:dephospho-CoA kinase|nr:dephospho-CoA kinase [Sphingomicrobium sp.]
MKIALTGSIGMGKSTVATMFQQAGIPVFDADAEVRKMQAYGGLLVEEIGQRFPGTVVDGAVDRERLSAFVLTDRDQLAALEMIVHPAVVRARERFIDENRGAPALLFEIPLLFETRAEGDFDKVIVVSAPPEVQRQRVLAREGMNEAKLAGLLARQLPDDEKRERADFVIDTRGSLDETRAQVDAILACLGLAGAR